MNNKKYFFIMGTIAVIIFIVIIGWLLWKKQTTPSGPCAHLNKATTEYNYCYFQHLRI